MRRVVAERERARQRRSIEREEVKVIIQMFNWTASKVQLDRVRQRWTLHEEAEEVY